jgi:hypothetical protein
MLCATLSGWGLRRTVRKHGVLKIVCHVPMVLASAEEIELTIQCGHEASGTAYAQSPLSTWYRTPHAPAEEAGWHRAAPDHALPGALGGAVLAMPPPSNRFVQLLEGPSE